MKTLNLLTIVAIFACLSLTSCNNDVLNQESDYNLDIKNEYIKKWVQAYGLIDKSQDWCTVTAVRADVTMGGKISKVKIYNADPAQGGHLIGVTSDERTLNIDVSEGASTVYAKRMRASGIVVDEGYYLISDGKVSIDGTGVQQDKVRSRAEDDEIKYAHTPSYFDAMIVCEDLGSVADVDFNDIVLGLRHVDGDATLTIVPMAAGGVLAANIYFKGNLIGEIHDMVQPGASSKTMLNTNKSHIGNVTNLQHITISLEDYPLWTIANGWSDITIEVENQDRTVNITAPTQGTVPQMICIGGDWFWPQETVRIETAYEAFPTWCSDANATTWLGDWKDMAIVKWDIPGAEPEEDTRMWYKVTTTDGKPYTIRLNGSATAATGQSGITYYIDTPWTSCEQMFTVYSDTETFELNREGNYIWSHPIMSNNIKTVEFSDNFDMSDVTSTAFMFAGCASLTFAGVSQWAAKPSASLTDAESMFKGCASLTSLDLSGWDVSNVGVFYDAFSGCSAMQTLDLSGWSFAVSADLRYMFENTNNLNVKCSGDAGTRLSGTTDIGGTNVTYTNP